MLREGTRFRDYHLNVCSNFGGLGDMIARLPAIKYAHDHFRQLHMNVYWHDYFIDVAKLLLPETDRLRHKTLSEMAWADDKIPLTDFSPRHISSFSMHLTEHAYLMLINRIPVKDRHLWYLQAPPLVSERLDKVLFEDPPGKFIGITLGYTALTRAWPTEEINKVIRWCAERELTPVLLGSSQKSNVGNGNGIQAKFDLDEIDQDFCINIIDKTTLIEALCVIQKCKAIIGVDNGLLHLASCTSTPVVWGFTSVLPEHRLPYLPASHRHAVVLPDDNLSCTGCQSKAYFVRHEFKYCLYKDYACTKQMLGEKFIDALKGLGL